LLRARAALNTWGDGAYLGGLAQGRHLTDEPVMLSLAPLALHDAQVMLALKKSHVKQPHGLVHTKPRSRSMRSTVDGLRLQTSRA
jgi:hypothetical protein